MTDLTIVSIVINAVSKFALTLDPVAGVVEPLLFSKAALAKLDGRTTASLEEDMGQALLGEDFGPPDSEFFDTSLNGSKPSPRSAAAPTSPGGGQNDSHIPSFALLTPPRPRRRLSDSDAHDVSLLSMHRGDVEDSFNLSQRTTDFDQAPKRKAERKDGALGTSYPMLFGVRAPRALLWFWCGMVRTALAGISLLIALYVPGFDRLLAFCGAFLSFTVSVILPPACYAAIFWSKLSWFSRILNVGIAVFGVICSIVGTAISVTGRF